MRCLESLPDPGHSFLLGSQSSLELGVLDFGENSLERGTRFVTRRNQVLAGNQTRRAKLSLGSSACLPRTKS